MMTIKGAAGMPIDPADLVAALRQLTDDQLAAVGLPRPSRNPFAVDQGVDRVSHIVDDERWYQLASGDRAVELYIRADVAVLHHYRRMATPARPAYLLDGFTAVDSVIDDIPAPVLAAVRAGRDDQIWAALSRFLEG